MITSKNTYYEKYIVQNKKNCKALWVNIQEIV